jgi:hypothetical protein
MTAKIVRTATLAIVATASAIAAVILFVAWSGVSLATAADTPAADFASRSGTVRMAVPLDLRDGIFAPCPLAATTKSARASKPKPMPASSKPIASPATKPTVT